MAVNTVSFYTIGSEFTVLVKDLIRSGQFWNAIEILRDGGLEDHQIRNFLFNGVEFEGDTRDGEGLEVIFKDDLNYDILIQGWRTLVTGLETEPYKFVKFEDSDNKHIKALKKIIPLSLLKSLLTQEILEDYGFKYFELDSANPLEIVTDGAILDNGDFIECGFQEHDSLYPILYHLDLADAPDWTKDTKTIHLSSSRISGKVAWDLENTDAMDYKELTITDGHLKGLFKLRDQIDGFYGFGRGELVDQIREFVSKKQDWGAKYGNLKFLKQFYPHINVPEIKPFLVNATDNRKEYCIRTSPDKSIAGLLNSKFDLTDTSEDEIWADWEKFKDVKPNNKLSIFYQKYLEGQNGVAHYIEKGRFSYAVSNNRGDVVNGKVSDGIIDTDLYATLRGIARELYNDLKKQIQLEFVVSEGKLWIVQLRTLKLPTKDQHHKVDHKDVILTGLSFNAGSGEFDINDILIVDKDTDSAELLGKRALIVRDDVEFSHVLALSQSLDIPSLFNTSYWSDKELPKEGKVRIDTESETAYVLKV